MLEMLNTCQRHIMSNHCRSGRYANQEKQQRSLNVDLENRPQQRRKVSTILSECSSGLKVEVVFFHFDTLDTFDIRLKHAG
jgi:hypothetical protein